MDTQRSSDGRSVRDFAPHLGTETLFLDHYPGMGERELAQIASCARARWDLAHIVIVHRVGTLSHGAQIVFIATASSHRSDAFRACEYIIDALKTRAPFWKRETLTNGQRFWVQQQSHDQARIQAWRNEPLSGKEAPCTTRKKNR
jgi:molybdopterin synthase catalytic subunit